MGSSKEFNFEDRNLILTGYEVSVEYVPDSQSSENCEDDCTIIENISPVNRDVNDVPDNNCGSKGETDCEMIESGNSDVECESVNTNPLKTMKNYQETTVILSINANDTVDNVKETVSSKPVNEKVDDPGNSNIEDKSVHFNLLESVNIQTMEINKVESNTNVKESNVNDQTEGQDVTTVSAGANFSGNPVNQSVNECTPIIIDEDLETDNDCTIVNTESSPHSIVPKTTNPKYHHDNVNSFDELQKENSTLVELIEMCLNMQNTSGMLRVINRNLIPIYKDADTAYKESAQFTKALSHTIIKLHRSPERKFSHIKDLCEQMKSGLIKKRVTLTSLQRSVYGRRKKKTFFSSATPKKKKKVDIINLDDDEDDVQISNTDVENKDVCDVMNSSSPSEFNKDCEARNGISGRYGQLNPTRDKDHTDIILIDDENDSSKNQNKENTIACESNERTATVSETVLNERRIEMENFNNNVATIDLCEEDEIVNSNRVFKPGELPRIRTVEVIEKEIAEYVKLINELEEQEVSNDNIDSPYVLCDSYKAKVVSLYKEICELVGSEPVKKHTVRMKPEEGHHEGPMRFFEMFVNSNFDEEGYPVFPDLVDVITCVQAANFEYNLGWSKKEIQAEARALFIHYGRTAQKQRQKREWRHLLRYVKQEAPDPAEQDPTLEARLVQNCQIAKKNEDELLARFAEMDKSGASNTELSAAIPESRVIIQQYDKNDIEKNLPTHFIPILPTKKPERCDINRIEESPANGILTKNQNNCESVKTVSLKTYEEMRKTGNVTDNLIIYNPWSVPVQIIAPSNIFNNVHPMLTNLNNVPVINNIVPPTNNLNNFPVINNIAPPTNNLNNFPVVNSIVQTTNNSNTFPVMNNIVPPTNKPEQHYIAGSSSFECFGTHKPHAGLNSGIHNSTSDIGESIPKTNNAENETKNTRDINEVTSNSTELKENIISDLSTYKDESSIQVKIEDTYKNYALPEELVNNSGKCSPTIQIEDLDNYSTRIKFEDTSNNDAETEGSARNLDKCSTRIEFEGAGNNDAVTEEAPTNLDKCSNRIEFEDAGNNDAVTEEAPTNLDTCSIGIKLEGAIVTENNVLSNSNVVSTHNDTTNLEGSSTNIKIKIENEDTINNTDGVTAKYSTKIKFEDANDSSVTNDSEQKSERNNGESQSDSEKCRHNKSYGSDSSSLLVKQEPLDVPRLLEQLGEDFTSTIIIEDPFMVIEISDSSESEDEDL